MNIKRKYLFFPDKEGREETGYMPDAKLRLRIRYDKSKVVNFNVGYRVELSKWVNEAQRCKTGTTHGRKKVSATEINNEIQRIEILADNVFKAFEVKGHIPTVDEYRNAFNEANGKENGSTITDRQNLFKLFDLFTQEVGKQNNWAKATYTKFAAIRLHLYAFNPGLSIAALSENDMQGFMDYMMYAVGLRNTTIAKNVGFIRWFLRWAYSKGHYSGTIHLTWRPRLKGTDGNQKEVIHLTWDELIHLYEFPIPESKQYLARVRDVFCFQCFTSLRYSDVAKLSRSDIKGTYMSIVTQKTVDGLKIELNKYSKAILDRYKDIHFPDDRALPVISNVKMNEYLKELGEIAEINGPQRIVYFKGNQRHEEVYPKHALLTTHCGRRTFIVNALFLGIPAEVVMRWTGHSDYKAMKPYIKIVDTLKEQEMNKFNEK
jgi:hypothetical protein